MTGRHAHASGKGAARDTLWLARLVGAVVVTLVALAALAAAFYYLFIGSSLVVAFSALSVLWAGLFIDGLIRRRRRTAYFRWFAASVLINMTSQLMNALAQRHTWPAHSHLLAQASNWTRWIGLALIGIAAVVGLKSGELRFWRWRSRPAVASAEADAEE
jgi:hypothetical protein